MTVLDRALRLLADHGADPAGSTFVDVGANIGTTTVTAVRRHRFAAAVALEPEPGNFRVLGLNLAANRIESRVSALQVAASDRAGEARLRLSTRSSGEHELAPSGQAGGDAEIAVRVVTLDGLAREGTIEPEKVGLLWVDAAGAEASVLAGASVLLARRVPVVVAVRPTLPGWPGARAGLVRLLGGYTHFADVRLRRPRVAADLPALLGSLARDGDVLAFRR